MRSLRVICSVMLAAAVVMALGNFFPVNAKVSNSPQTYTVMVGMENPHQGIDVMAYFPDNVTIHEGDTVHWVINSNEIHTVTFLGGIQMPETPIVPAASVGADTSFGQFVFAPVVVNAVIPPGGEYTGGPGAFANSGLMGREPGQSQEFDLSFPDAGTFDYLCLIHGFEMSGTVTVKPQNERIPSPNQSMAEGKKQMAKDRALIPGVVKEASAQIKPPEKQPDGTVKYFVEMGYHSGQIDLLQFFPDKLVVRPGDQVVFEMSATNDAPHTVTFLNGGTEPALAIPHGGYLYINPEVLLPSPLPPEELTRTGYFNSGLMQPVPGTSYSLTIGDMKPGLQPWLCLIHDSSGMTGTLKVVPRN